MPKPGNRADAIAHDSELFAQLLLIARRIDPDVRSGSMFGCPAIYHGRKMAACVLGSTIGMRVPKSVAIESLESGRARSFQPFGKPAMKEWVQLDGGMRALELDTDLIASAIRYAKANNLQCWDS
jgi:TfoX/Sxy family transcriptional regulator of competence genes